MIHSQLVTDCCRAYRGNWDGHEVGDFYAHPDGAVKIRVVLVRERHTSVESFRVLALGTDHNLGTGKSHRSQSLSHGRVSKNARISRQHCIVVHRSDNGVIWFSSDQ